MKCQICSKGLPRFAPELVASGYAAPKDMKCPICDTVYNEASGMTLEEWEKEQEQKTTRIRQGLLADPEYYTPDLWEV